MVLLGVSVWVLETLPVRASLVRLQWAGSASVANTIVREVPGPYRAALGRDLLLLIPLYTVGLITAGVWPFRAAAALSFVKFSALVVAAGVGLVAIGTTIGRRVQHGTTKTAGTEP